MGLCSFVCDVLGYVDGWVWFWAITGVLLYVLWTYINPFPGGYRKPSRPALDPGPDPTFSGRVIECRNPATGEVIKEENSATDEEVELALERAQKAQKEWANSTLEERAALLYDFLDWVVNNQEEICSLSVQDTGKTMMEAYYGEVLTTCEKLRWIIRYGANALKTESRPPPFLLMFNKKARVEYYPIGVIGIIIPWNYPFHNSISAIAAAVFAGNAAVVKVSEWATASRQRFDGVFRQLLARRGWSPDLVQLLPGYGDTGAALCRSPRVGKILFIGSPATGKRVMSAASAQLTPVVLELGGKDPFIVLPDAEFDHAVEVALRGVFINNGQNCLAAERLYIHRSIYDKFREEILRRARELRSGVPPCLRAAGDEQGEGQVDCGAMTMPGQVEIVASLVSDALDRGARLLLGGISRLPSEKEGEERHRLFFPPTILADVTHEMRIVNEEAFGPVMLLIPFDSDEQLVEMANGTGYGLGCSIFSTDYARAERIGRQISSGMLTINDFGLGYLIQSLPFGGCKISGFGRFNGVEGLREFSIQKSVVTDRFNVRTKSPRFTQYPVPPKATAVINNAVTLLYSGSAQAKFQALIKMTQALLTLEKP